MRQTKLALAALLLAAAATAAGGAPLALKADRDTVVVEPSSNSDSMILYGVTMTNRNYLPEVRSVAVVLKRNGRAPMSFNAAAGIPLRSIWVAVDPENGDYTISGRAGYPVHRLEFPAAAFQGGTLSLNCVSLDVMLVRPGAGAWSISARDGGFGDADRTGNGAISIDLNRARAVEGDAEPPKSIQEGDVIVAIDRMHMDLFAARIGGAR